MDDIWHDFLIYRHVEEIIIWEDEKFNSFFPQALHMAYEIGREDTRVVVSWSNLPWYGVLNSVLKNGKKFIVEKDTSWNEHILL